MPGSSRQDNLKLNLAKGHAYKKQIALLEQIALKTLHTSKGENSSQYLTKEIEVGGSIVWS